ncbi:unnamed protein product [Peniophora sp. CBMAI 1063]|nr:unnamed protein product [Peniophora sp. CBMAI 1063]
MGYTMDIHYPLELVRLRHIGDLALQRLTTPLLMIVPAERTPVAHSPTVLQSQDGPLTVASCARPGAVQRGKTNSTRSSKHGVANHERMSAHASEVQVAVPARNCPSRLPCQPVPLALLSRSLSYVRSGGNFPSRCARSDIIGASLKPYVGSPHRVGSLLNRLQSAQ